MSGGALDFTELVALAGHAATADVPCPFCGPSRPKGFRQRRKVLRIWRHDPAFASYCCARCGEKGYARDGDAKRPADPIERARRQLEADTASEAHALKQRVKARWLWESARPIAGTVAERYLRGRGITCPLPWTLRFLPPRDGYPPSMIAPFGQPAEPWPGHAAVPDRRVQGVHITRLKPDGSGKAPPDAEGRTRIMIGPSDGWPIPLAPPNNGGSLAVAEGIETALSAAQEGLGAWAAGSAGRLPKLAAVIAPIAAIEAVTILAEDDDAGRKGAEELACELARLRPDIEVRAL